MLYHHKSTANPPDNSANSSNKSNSQSPILTWHVAGMDCASCVNKIKTKVESLPNVQDVKVILSTEKLIVTATHEDTGQQVEQAVESLGYTITAQQAAAHQHQHEAFTWHSFLIPAIMAIIMIVSALLLWQDQPIGKYGFILATLVGLVPIAKKSLSAIQGGSPFAIETLMSISAIGALFIDATEEAAMVLFLFMIGELLESFSANHARKGVKSLMALMPNDSVVIKNGARLTVPSHQLQPNDVIEVSAGGRLPADAELLSDQADIDESALTGESMPVTYAKNANLSAGTLVVDQTILLRVTSEPGNNAVDRILHLIENAEEKKAPIERFIDTFSRYYTPAIMFIALLVLLIPTLIFGHDWHTWIYRSLTLLLIGCPCALVISTPAAITAAMANASRHGALVKGGAALEALGKIQTIAFDKTGTLTVGSPSVTQIITAPDWDEKSLLAHAAAVEIGSHHPLAKAIIQRAEALDIPLTEAQDRKTLPGMGIEGNVNGAKITLRSPHQSPMALSDFWQSHIAMLEEAGNTVVIVTKENEPVGLIALQDTLRPEAEMVLTDLHRLGITTVMLTGDNPRTAQKMADSLNMKVHAKLLPADKVNYVTQLNQTAPTAMVGDGINDAPAMKAATIGIAMGGGTDVALDTADAALSSRSLTPLPTLISLARATRNNIQQNITLALGLKGIFLVTSILGITGLWIAVLADSGATALITANALRLLRYKKRMS